MRQSDGSEILGPDDPRTIVIGIIHVTPGDDRQSVLTAISAQEQQGRDQIVLDLPAQNKAFKNAVDFEGLRSMSSEIEASLVLVTPPRSKIAGYAKKEGFSVYDSLDELTAAEFPPLEPEEEEDEQAAPIEDDSSDHAIIFPIASPAATAGAQNQAAPTTPDTEEEDEEDEASTAPLEEEDETPTSPELGAVVAPTAAASTPDEQEDTASSAVASDTSRAVTTVHPTGSLPAVQNAGTGTLVPSGSQPPTLYYAPAPAPPQRRSWRGLIIAAIIIVLLIALGVAFNRPILDLFFPPTATVAITPDSRQLQHAYQFTAVLGVPDPSKNQVDARAVFASSQPQSTTVKATGQGSIPGQPAQGVLVFYNTLASPLTIQAGTVIFDPHNSNVVAVNNDTITLPAFDPTQGPVGVKDQGHTLNPGSNQNIPMGELKGPVGSSGAYVNNMAFGGGQDPQTYAYVQQSDIDGAAQSLETTLNGQTTQILQSHVRSNEHTVGQPRCSPQVQSSNGAGDRVNNLTVTVVMNCLGEVYDMQAVQVLAARKLTQDASVNPGPAYAPVGDIVAQVTRTTQGTQGDVQLSVNALGVWVYQFTPTQRAALVHLIAGKSSQDARTILRRQPGVANAIITLTGIGVSSVPDDLSRITVNVEAVQGLHP